MGKRIYLTQRMDAQLITETGGVRDVSFPSAGFYKDVPDELAGDWIEHGMAFDAAPNNVAIAYRGTERVSVDVAAGEKLEGLAPRPQLPPPAEPVPSAEPPSADPEGQEVN